MIKQQAAALADANSKREELTKQLSEVQEKVATISGTDAKTSLLTGRFSGETGRAQALERSGCHHRRRAAESADASG